MIPFSVLDLSPIPAGSSAADAFRHSRELAQHAEKLGYLRYWLAEHHNMTGIASAATAVVIGHVAAGTKTIRVGSGGVMLPNHAPLVIAEQFGTLASLFPDRIDLGLGRAPGTDQTTSRALRRDLQGSADTFPDDVVELMRYFADPVEGQRVRAVPGAGLHVPVWLLGSSLFSAQLAAALGLPFAFASHFAPDYLLTALRTYRAQFRPSKTLERPYAMVGVNVFAADRTEEAELLFTSLQQQFINLRRGTPGQLPPPVETGAVVRCGTRGRRTFARVLSGGRPGTGRSGSGFGDRADPGRRTDRHSPDLRPRRAPAFVRDHGTGARGAGRGGTPLSVIERH